MHWHYLSCLENGQRCLLKIIIWQDLLKWLLKLNRIKISVKFSLDIQRFMCIEDSHCPRKHVVYYHRYENRRMQCWLWNPLIERSDSVVRVWEYTDIVVHVIYIDTRFHWSKTGIRHLTALTVKNQHNCHRSISFIHNFSSHIYQSP